MVSKVWNLFTRQHKYLATCNVCSKAFTIRGGSTSNMLGHAKKYHVVQYKIHCQEPTMITENLMDLKQENIASILNDQDLEIDTSTSASVVDWNSRNQAALDESLLQAVASCDLPPSVVDNEQFISFINLLKHDYNLPSSESLESMMITRSQRVRTVDTGFLGRGDPICMSVRSVGKDIHVMFHVVDEENMSREDILHHIFKKHESTSSLSTLIKNTTSLSILENVHSFVCDHEYKYGRLGIDMVLSEYHCFSKIIDNLVHAIFEIPAFHSLILIIDPESEKNGRYTFPWKEVYSGLCNASDKVNLQNAWSGSKKVDMENMILLKDVLTPIEMGCRKTIEENESIGCLLGVACMIKTSIKNLKQQKAASDVIGEVEKLCDKHLEEFTASTPTQYAAFFDPRFAFLDTILDEEEWKAIGNELAEALMKSEDVIECNPSQPSTSSSNDSLWNAIIKKESKTSNTVQMEVAIYRLAVESSRPSISSSPLPWWSKNIDKLPILWQNAKKYLSIPAVVTQETSQPKLKKEGEYKEARQIYANFVKRRRELPPAYELDTVMESNRSVDNQSF